MKDENKEDFRKIYTELWGGGTDIFTVQGIECDSDDLKFECSHACKMSRLEKMVCKDFHLSNANFHHDMRNRSTFPIRNVCRIHPTDRDVEQ